MSIDAWTALGVVTLVIALMIFTRAAPHLVLGAGLVLLLTAGVIDEKQMLEGLANPGMITVGVLFAVAAGLRET